ncbi:lachesin-like isoform X2 [Daktulosphaira vitifoliae]|uniref:lachesin-like isoform X2 n=1 Tax=Daktulosphaira vitifoliae TaxID=58002 RepID=UPI0021AA5CB6|nr:lachesin-like isoform X2 [Daktulosphaira vitifoliae]
MLLFSQRPDRYLIIWVFQILTVICAVLTDDPNFAEPIPNVTVSLGRDASLPCVVNNLGTYKVAWIHIDRQMILTIHRHVIARIPRFGITHDSQKTWLLHVKGAQPEDRGYYMCQVNTNPMISQVGYLQVVVPPNIIDDESSASSVSVRENQNLSLTCKAEGSPTPKISWKREDGGHIATDRKRKVEKLQGDTLNLTRVTRADMGAYLCIASNGVPPSVSKRIILDVEFSPMIWVPNQLVGAPSGTDVTIDCQTEAHPKSINYWSFQDSKTMLFQNKKYVTSDTENSYRIHMKLTIKDLSQSDFGNYKCISKNSLGETEGSIRLYEIPKPSLAPKSSFELNKSNKDGNWGSSGYSRSQIMITTFGVITCFTSSHHIP